MEGKFLSNSQAVDKILREGFLDVIKTALDESLVSLVEDICIGSDSCIGAGAVVTKDVVSGMTVAGVPAQVIGVNIHANYVHNRWEIANCNI